MSGLRARAEEYLAMRRALGFKLDNWGPRLMSFVSFCEDRGAMTVTTDLAVEWATTTSRACLMECVSGGCDSGETGVIPAERVIVRE